MKFKDLRVEDLKKELSKLELCSTGNKAELQKRLLEEFERRGMNIDEYEFDGKEEVELSAKDESSVEEVSSVAARGDDLKSMLAMMMLEMNKKNEETSRLMAEMKSDNCKMLEEMSRKNEETSRLVMEMKVENCRMVEENSSKMLEEMSRKNEETSRLMMEMKAENCRMSEENSRKLEEKFVMLTLYNNGVSRCVYDVVIVCNTTQTYRVFPFTHFRSFFLTMWHHCK
ncbi:uncharacterized protein [Musca autumnalis]|uniref:uncharacterized protein n=1 Tax=Musca autumnalis TaxID=221902 RepID=UPI003CF9838B